MKYSILLFLLLPLLTFSQQTINQTDSRGLKQGYWQKKYPSGTLMYEGYFTDGKPTGHWKRYHESGGVKAILQYSEKGDSVKALLFENSEEPVAEGSYVGEKKEGLWIYFSGKIKIAEERFSGGLKNGQCRKYYNSGELLEESEWKNNQLEGKYSAYFQSGKPYLQCMYSQNRRNGRCFSYFQSGNPEVESFYQNDLPEGTWKYFDDEGNLRYTLIYEKGLLKNPEVLLELDSDELDSLEKQRDRFAYPEKYLQNPEEYFNRNR